MSARRKENKNRYQMEDEREVPSRCICDMTFGRTPLLVTVRSLLGNATGSLPYRYRNWMTHQRTVQDAKGGEMVFLVTLPVLYLVSQNLKFRQL